MIPYDGQKKVIQGARLDQTAGFPTCFLLTLNLHLRLF